jgi:AFG3 family protein
LSCFLIDIFARHAKQRTTDLLTKHKEDVRSVANLLLEKEVITRFALLDTCGGPWLTDIPHREDMVRLLGKRPFARHDDMDKWLDENQKKTQPQAVDPPVAGLDDAPAPAPAPAFKRVDEQL